MAQKITGYIKLQIEAGKATPAPPVGPALGQHGVNIMDVCKQFNEKTAKEFAIYLDLFNKYKEEYRLQILHCGLCCRSLRSLYSYWQANQHCYCQHECQQ